MEHFTRTVKIETIIEMALLESKFKPTFLFGPMEQYYFRWSSINDDDWVRVLFLEILKPDRVKVSVEKVSMSWWICSNGNNGRCSNGT